MSILIILHRIFKFILSLVQVDSILDEESGKVKDSITLRNDTVLGIHSPVQTKPKKSFLQSLKAVLLLHLSLTALFDAFSPRKSPLLMP